MLKKLVALILSFIFVFTGTHTAKSSENFETILNAEYKVLETGETLVTNTITIKNLRSNYYPKKFILTLANIKTKNIKAYETGSLLHVLTEEKDNKILLNIIFNESSVGKNNSKTFVVTYEVSGLAQKNGEIWEVILPKIDSPELFKEYKTVLSIPKTFGTEAYISPEPVSSKELDDRNYYFFSKENLENTGVTAGFGKFQIFSFKINYHLSNPTEETVKVDFSLPPDTSTQRMFYEAVNPKPQELKLDSDGNWIAYYTLLPKQNIDAEAKGSVQIFASPIKLNVPDESTFKESLKPDNYWQSDDAAIKSVASKYKTPKEIYDFVSSTLKYDLTRIGSNPTRLGAKAALEKPESALCTEFTDLFIALARANGIPAREINGYAYSQNPELEPLSLVSDVLHSWPEYWDPEREVWVPVDPTWASTTGGVDFFSKFDLRHFAFVIHGKNPVKPYSAGSYKLGDNPQKDVFISFGNLPDNRYPEVAVTYEFGKRFSLSEKDLLIKLENKSGSASYNNQINTYLGANRVITDKADVVLPFSGYVKSLKISYGFMGTKSPEFIRIVASGSNIDVPTFKMNIIINQLLVIASTLIIALGGYLILTGKKYRFWHKK